MKLDVPTLAFVMGLTGITQVFAILIQYRVNKTYRGIGWWLLGSALMALGFICLSRAAVMLVGFLPMFGNPLLISARVCLFIGVNRFIDKKERTWITVSLLVGFILVYYYYLFWNNNLSGRTVVVSAAVATFSLMIAYNIFSKSPSSISGSARFTGSVFLVHGCWLMMVMYYTLVSPSIHSYAEYAPIQVAVFVVPTITSMLWTFGFILMVNQRLNADYRQSKETLERIFNTSPDAASITRLTDGVFVDVNEGFSAMSGYTRGEIIGSSIIGSSIWRDVEARRRFVTALRDQGACENLECVFQRKGGSQFVGMVSAKLLTINDTPHVICIVRDITERMSGEEALRESEETYRSILNASPDDITITDMEGRILMVSPAANKMFGYEPGEEVGLRVLDFIVPEDQERARTNVVLLMHEQRRAGPSEYRGVRKDRSIFEIEIDSGLIHGTHGQPTKMVFIVRDITERKRAQQKIEQLVQQLETEKKAAEINAVTDSLTGLANRRYFDEALRAEFYRLKRSGASLSLIIIDIDHFKHFNDRYGHLAGDECLRRVGTTLKTVVGRIPDVVARYGGEEFVVILPETGRDGAGNVAERIRNAVADLALPHSASDTAQYVTVSLGVVTVYATRVAGPEVVVALADEALYCAKRNGRNRIAVAANDAGLGEDLPK